MCSVKGLEHFFPQPLTQYFVSETRVQIYPRSRANIVKFNLCDFN